MGPSAGNGSRKPVKFGESLFRRANPEPSPDNIGEGVETRWQAPQSTLRGDGIVQTTNPPCCGAMKVVAVA